VRLLLVLASCNACLDKPPAPGEAIDAATPDARRLGSRTPGAIAQYLFDEGEGDRATDSSAMGSPLHLQILDIDSVVWREGFLSVEGDTRLAQTSVSRKLFEAVPSTNELTVEAWVRTPFVVQPSAGSPHRILSHAIDHERANFILAQDGAQWLVRLRTTKSDPDGDPPLVPALVIEANVLRHLVFTHSSDGIDDFYIDGVSFATATRLGDFST